MSESINKERVRTLNVSTIKSNLQRNQEDYNPCLKEYDLSLKCLSDNNYVYDACKPYFRNYKNCQHFWTQVVFDRAKKNIVPHLPPPHDRTKVKNEYLKSTFVK